MIPIQVMSRNKAIRYSHSDHPKTLLISIRDKGRHIPYFVKDNLIIHYFDFDDVEEGSPNGFPISDFQAKRIAEVVNSNKDVEKIVVHCEAGVSRSAGVAAAIGMAINGDDSFIFNDGNFNNVPPFSYLLRSTILNPEIEELQRNKDIASAYALLVGELRIFDGAKSGEKPNQWAISPEMVGAFLSKVQSGLRKNVRPVAMPTEETKYMQFVDSSPLMSTYKYSESAAQGASASTLIYSTSKPNQEELRVMVQTDYNMMKNLYYQFNSFMNYFINKKTRKYKFNFEFTGMNYTFYRKEQADLAIKFADKGFVFNSSYYASILGLKPQEFDRMLTEGHFGNMVENLSMLINMNTMSSSGRPQKDSNDLSHSGNVSQEYGNYDKGL